MGYRRGKNVEEKMLKELSYAAENCMAKSASINKE